MQDSGLVGFNCKQLKRLASSIKEEQEGCRVRYRKFCNSSSSYFPPQRSLSRKRLWSAATVNNKKAVLYPRGTLPATPATVRGGGKYSLRTETTRVCLQRFLQIAQHVCEPLVR